MFQLLSIDLIFLHNICRPKYTSLAKFGAESVPNCFSCLVWFIYISKWSLTRIHVCKTSWNNFLFDQQSLICYPPGLPCLGPHHSTLSTMKLVEQWYNLSCMLCWFSVKFTSRESIRSCDLKQRPHRWRCVVNTYFYSKCCNLIGPFVGFLVQPTGSICWVV